MRLLQILLILLFLHWGPNSGKCQIFTNLGSGISGEVKATYYDSVTNYLYAGGLFQSLGSGQPILNIARWDGNTWDSLDTGVQGAVRSIISYNGELYVGGQIVKFGNVFTNGVAKWDGNQWQSIVSITDNGQFGKVFDLAVLNNELYIAGEFDNLNGMPANGVAKFDGQTWNTFPTIDQNGVAYCVALYNGELYVGGDFNAGSGLNDIVKWNGLSWVTVGGGFSGSNTAVNDLIVYNGELYVGGWFKTTYGDPGNHIVSWNGTGWNSLQGGTQPGNVTCMHIFKNELYIGGQLSSAGTIPVDYISKWNGTNWLNTGGNFDNTVLSFTSSPNELFIGGGFWTVNSVTVNRIAKYSPVVGYEEIQNVRNEISIYPNPSTGIFNLQVISNKNATIVSDLLIHDINGRLLSNKHIINRESYTIDISNETPGVYFLKFNVDGNSKFTKLILQPDIK